MQTDLNPKIKELETWLEDNHAHPDRATVSEDLRKLKENQKQTEANALRAN